MAMNLNNELPEKKTEATVQNADGVQYASGGHPGMEMAAGSPETVNTTPDFKAATSEQADFLMIQLSSFEGRADH